MLILTRRLGEDIFIGKNIKITILSDRKGQVRIGIDAPKHIPIYRDEIHRKIQCKQQREEGEELIEE